MHSLPPWVQHKLDTLRAMPSKDSSIQAAAHHISECDFLLVATGAGFSADSGLPTYNDVAKNPIYEKQAIDYSDLCRISCLRQRPALFYGFWGSCFNAYQNAEPHAGYDILKKWCQQREDYYLYTSNVDGHFRRKGFATNRMHEMHGAIDTWLEVESIEGIETIMEDKPHVLDTFFRFPIDNQLELQPDILKQVFSDKKSRLCSQVTPSYRPKVLMFDDGLEVHKSMGLHESSNDYQTWEESMESRMEGNNDFKLVVLEIGCGTKVPSVRRECEDVVADTASRATGKIPSPSRFVHIRINPDDYEINNDNSTEEITTIGIQGGALETLCAIDARCAC